MTGTAKALNAFYSGFGLEAYPEGSVPSDAELPYITYSVVEPEWRRATMHQARVWYRTESYREINAKVDEILNAVGEMKLFKTEGGYVALRAGNPRAQYQAMDEPEIKVAYLNFQINSYQR